MSTKPLIYLDYASATPMEPRVLEAMRPYFTDEFYNPSATYSAGRAARQAVETARSQAAHWLGARPAEVVFTAGGTEANNLAIHGVMRQFPDGNMVTAGTEHDSVLKPAGRYECRRAAVGADGRIDLADLRRQIDGKTALVSIAYANNEIGTIQPLREIAAIIAEKRAERSDTEQSGRPLYFHTDACQAANYLDLHAARLGVDLMTLDGSKIYGPKQSGCLYVKAGTVLKPLLDGGHQELGLRGGTENVAGSIGFAAALDIAQQTRRDEAARLAKLRDDFIKRLEADIPTLQVNGSRKYRLPNNIHVTIPGQDNERLLFALDEAGILAGAGSACNASDEEPSHVLRAIGISEADARASLRFALGHQTAASMLDQTAKVLKTLVTA